MSSISEAIHLALMPTALAVLRTLIVCYVLLLAPCGIYQTKYEGQRLRIFNTYTQNYLLPAIIPFGLAWIWLSSVSKAVPGPYLDEFFHIPQAQVYCEGKILQWDDKITTPPGLYIFSIIGAKLLGYADCSAATLRLFNVYVIACTAVLAGACRAALDGSGSDKHRNSIYSIHTAVNVGLFPVLFFFSGLYYTDVLSTCVLLLAYLNHLNRVDRNNNSGSLADDLYTVSLGVLGLFLRQTNVFWVVVYMGALEAVQSVKDIRPDRVDTPKFSTLAEQLKFYAWRYSAGEIHDPSLNVSWPDDMALCVISIGIATICNLGTVLRRVYPHIVVLALFGGFVAWNGGVVLGDKSNHVATLHLAQMLYIWPLFTFFSAPLFVPQALPLLRRIYILVTWKSRNASARQTQGLEPANTKTFSSRRSNTVGKSVSKEVRKQDSNITISPPNPPQRSAALKTLHMFMTNGPLLSLIMAVVSLLAALVTIRFNTTIHPFTLADNRHYMFYIFRYTILRGSIVRHALAPVYVFCAYLSWTALAGCVPPWFSAPTYSCPLTFQEEHFISSPFTKPGVNFMHRRALNAQQAQNANPQPKGDDGELYGRYTSATTPPPTSTVLILLLATALSLVTAPLVEPRYFILPWVFWRLLVPAWPTHVHAIGKLVPPTKLAWLLHVGRSLDLRLVLETAWFLVVNAATMYIFLTRPFYWKAEDGTLLDGGNVQRFMW